MKDERHEQTSVADEGVSRSYREIAGERAPERLDRAILDEAARAARPRYARSRAWTRPLAWAATIVLSAAIVLELTQVPAPEEGRFDPATPTTDDIAAGTPAVEAAAEAAPEATPGRSADVLPKSPEKANLMQKASAPAPIEAGDGDRERQDAPAEPVPESASAPVEAAAFELEDKDLRPRTDEIAETRFQSTRREAVAAGQASRSLASAPETCPDEVRRDPETWLACITELEQAGLDAEADAERRLLREAYPAFELP